MGGYSGGAMMTLRYACEVPGRIAGTALVGAQMITTLAAKCDTSAPPAMMFIDGDEDPLASYDGNATRSEEHTSELQSLMRISYAVFCLKKKQLQPTTKSNIQQ